MSAHIVHWIDWPISSSTADELAASEFRFPVHLASLGSDSFLASNRDTGVGSWSHWIRVIPWPQYDTLHRNHGLVMVSRGFTHGTIEINRMGVLNSSWDEIWWDYIHLLQPCWGNGQQTSEQLYGAGETTSRAQGFGLSFCAMAKEKRCLERGLCLASHIMSHKKYIYRYIL